MGELVLITGTSSGIGLCAAVECAAAGHRVIATMRDPERRGVLEAAAKARGLVVHVEQLDVTLPGAGDKIRELVLKFGPVYALVNNAGVAMGGAFEEQGEAVIRAQFETNVFGVMAVTRAVLPSMRGGPGADYQRVEPLGAGRLSAPVDLCGHQARARGVQRGAPLGAGGLRD